MIDQIDRQAVLSLPRDTEKTLSGEIIAQYVNVADIEKLPSVQLKQTDCGYCHEDRDGCVYVLEKNGHAVIRGNKLMLAAKGWRGEAEIKYCPMCGRELKHG